MSDTGREFVFRCEIAEGKQKTLKQFLGTEDKDRREGNFDRNSSP
jgi:hypothetical protein